MTTPQWHERLSEDQKRDLPPKSGETMRHYIARWIGHVNRESQLKLQKQWDEREKE